MENLQIATQWVLLVVLCFFGWLVSWVDRVSRFLKCFCCFWPFSGGPSGEFFKFFPCFLVVLLGGF